MPLAIHEGGPADGQKVSIDQVMQHRHYAPAAARSRADWVVMGRYVFLPPRDKAKCRYRYTGSHQQQGPVPPLDAEHPDWS
jgi:hypothetical protein